MHEGFFLNNILFVDTFRSFSLNIATLFDYFYEFREKSQKKGKKIFRIQKNYIETRVGRIKRKKKYSDEYP